MKYIIALSALCLYASPSFAELQQRQGGMIYDTDLNITWIADTNLAKTSGYHEDGFMHWSDAYEWVENLEYGGFSDWRLPSYTNPDPGCASLQGQPQTEAEGFVNAGGFTCTLSEMGHLFYVELGGSAGRPIVDSTDPDVGLFVFADPLPFQQTTYYFTGGWRGRYSPINNTDVYVAIFSFSSGILGACREEQARCHNIAFAVRDGDVLRVIRELPLTPLGQDLRPQNPLLNLESRSNDTDD